MADKTQAQFDPDAYLAQAGDFDPDKYLANAPASAPVAGRPQFQTPQAFSSANYMTAGYAAAPEEQGRAVKGMVEYGIPALAAVGTMGMSIPAAAAISSLTSGAANLASQYLEKAAKPEEKISGREAAASAVAGLAVPVPLKPVAGEVVPAAKAALNFLTNAAFATGAGETARYIERGQFEKPKDVLDYSLRFGLPVGASALGSYAGLKSVRAQEAATRAEDIIRERGASGMLGEIMPEYATLEARQYKAQNKFAIEAANDLSTGVDQRVADLVKDAPNQSEIASKLQPAVVNLDGLRVKTVEARRQATDLAEKAALTAQTDAREAAALYQQANEAGVEAVKQKALFVDAAEKLAGSSINDISELASGNRIERVKELAGAAKDSVKIGLDKLYQRANIGINDPVASLEFIVRRVGRSIESIPDRMEVLGAIEKSIKQTKGMTDDAGNLTLAGFRRIRDDIASGLVKEGRDTKYANRVAGQAYEAITSAMEDTLASMKTDDASLMRKYVSSGVSDQGVSFKDYVAGIPAPDVKAYKDANKIAAGIYKARDAETGAIEMISNGDIKGLVGLIESEGYGPVAKNIQSYAKALLGVGDDASKAAAGQFVSDVHAAIRDHLIDTSLRAGQGVDEVSKTLDVPKLIQRIDSLRQKGISPEALGFGSKDTIKAMARVAAANGNSMNAQEFTQFMQDAASLGADKAAAAQLYDQTYRKFLIEKGVEEKKALAKKLEAQRKEADFKAGVLENVMQRAENDPLVKLFNEPGLGISPNPTANTQYVNKVLDAGPNTVGKLVRTLQEGVPGDAKQTLDRLTTLESLKKSAVADVLGETLAKAFGPKDQKANLEKITDFFYSPSQKTRRESLAALIGDEAFKRLELMVGKPSSSILRQYRNVTGPIPDVRSQLILAAGAIGQAQGGSTAGVMKGNLYDRFLTFIQKHQYNVLYGWYVNPETSKEFVKHMGDINAFVNANPRNAALYRIMRDQDEANNSQPTP